jgi:hypothetical protein
MNFPNVSQSSTLPPIPPPSPYSSHNKAQNTHLSDLQHQVSVKTLALQTLQKEYDSLLQKLDRQRTKCAALEKKFEVSDVEINTLTEEKERLAAQIIDLETQVEELQSSRDQTRRDLTANNAQYLQIMKMDAQLQAQATAEKKRWMEEREDLERQIRALETVIGRGGGDDDGQGGTGGAAGGTPHAQRPSSGSARPADDADSITALRNRVMKLTSRNQVLEEVMRKVRDQNAVVCQARKHLDTAGDNLRHLVEDALGEEEKS